MLKYTTGNLINADAEALVNTVNEVGVMGKGIALMFAEGFPENTRLYKSACARNEVKVGAMHVTRNQEIDGPKWIINFPTKKHWRQPSQLAWIRDGLQDLVCVIKEHDIKSVAIPPLGCGAGGLEWQQVKAEIEFALAKIPEVNAIVYEPTNAYQNAPKRSGVTELTAARAIIAELVRRYAILGIECSNIEVQKMAWFIQRVIKLRNIKDPLKLVFVAGKYGPYADNLRHLLNQLDGSYLHCEKRLSDAGPNDYISFSVEKAAAVKNYVTTTIDEEYRAALDITSVIIDGYESPLQMELLATVDWLLSQGGCEPNISSIRQGLASWPGGDTAGKRKQKIFDDRLLTLAIGRLKLMDSIPTITL